MTYILPRRGKLEELHLAKFVAYELFYVTDIKKLGIADEDGKPQLFLDVEEINDFSLRGEEGKIYFDTENGNICTYNGSEFVQVNIKYDRFKRNGLLRLK